MAQPLPASIRNPLPLTFVDSTCLRCARPLLSGRRCRLVRGGEIAQYRSIALTICNTCRQPPGWDIQVAKRSIPVAAGLGADSWPRYIGMGGIEVPEVPVIRTNPKHYYVGDPGVEPGVSRSRTERSTIEPVPEN